MAAILQFKVKPAWIDAFFGVVFAALVPLSYREAHLAAEEAVRLYSHNVDSGAYLIVIAVTYFAPASLLFGLASLALFRGWKHRMALHWVAWLWLSFPFIWVAVTMLVGIVAA
jgi:hypothetical protein